MVKLNHRQNLVLNFIRRRPSCQTGDLLEYFNNTGAEDVSRITLVRDLNYLLKNRLIRKSGQGRNVAYSEKITNDLLAYFDPDDYFKAEPDDRQSGKSFDFGIFGKLKGLFSPKELERLEKINSIYAKRIKKITPGMIKKEWERLTIELSWKSSQIEGNTYSLIDTEALIKEHQEAKGHKRSEATMILNHKAALDWIFFNAESFKKVSLAQIESLHRLLTKGMEVGGGIRKSPVGIVGTKYRPLDNQHQIREALEKTAKAVNAAQEPLEKALLVSLLVAYIQPFEDGNKRTSRILANAILMANGYCPLSYRSIDEAEYKKAVILFYEQNSASYFKQLFIDQFEFAVKNYFLD